METLDEVFALAGQNLPAALEAAALLPKSKIFLNSLLEKLDSDNDKIAMLAEELLLQHHDDNYKAVRKIVDSRHPEAAMKAKMIICKKHAIKASETLLIGFYSDWRHPELQAAAKDAVKNKHKHKSQSEQAAAEE